MRRWAVIGVSVALTTVAAPAFAQLPVPMVVQTPPIQVAGVQVPGIQVPVPTVQVPVPTVQVPVPVPTVQVPIPTVQVPVPTVQVPVPTVHAPTPVPTAAPPAATTPPSSGGGAADPSSPTSSSESSVTPSPAAGEPGSATTPTVAGTQRTRVESTSAPARSQSRAATTQCIATGCTLRETVAGATGCLDALTAAERRVLVLRAGVGSGSPRSRAGVAKQLKISERRVIRLERSGLQRLRTLDRAGRCAATTTTTSAVAATTPGGVAPTFATPAGGVKSATSANRSKRPGGISEPEGTVPTFPKLTDDGSGNGSVPGGIDLTIPFVVLLGVAAVLALGRRLRREQATVAPEAPEAIPPFAGPSWTDPRPLSDRHGEWSAPDEEHALPR